METHVSTAITAAEALQRLGGWAVAILTAAGCGYAMRAMWTELQDLRRQSATDLTDLSRGSTVALTEVHKALVAITTKLDYMDRERRG